MTPRNFRFLLVGLAAALFFGGWLAWWTSPTQVAKRFLTKVTNTATVLSEDSPLSRRMRAPKLSSLLANPFEISMGNAISGKFDQEELLTGYLSIALGSSYFEPRFTAVRLILNTEDSIQISAQLDVESDYPDASFPISESVEVTIRKIEDLLILSEIHLPDFEPSETISRELG
ncbi:MAG: hypothetical protein AAF191_16355 [Verrucomicrobiota bacterium]